MGATALPVNNSNMCSWLQRLQNRPDGYWWPFAEEIWLSQASVQASHLRELQGQPHLSFLAVYAWLLTFSLLTFWGTKATRLPNFKFSFEDFKSLDSPTMPTAKHVDSQLHPQSIPLIRTAPPEIITCILQECADFADVISLASSCASFYSIWKSESTRVIWPVGGRSIIAFSTALLAVCKFEYPDAWNLLTSRLISRCELLILFRKPIDAGLSHQSLQSRLWTGGAASQILASYGVFLICSI